MTTPSPTVKWLAIAAILATGLIHAAEARDAFSEATYKGLLFVGNGVGLRCRRRTSRPSSWTCSTSWGYGTSRADLLRVGRSGDGGIDGVISLDRLGLEKVYVQAKRWQSSVGRPEVQAFYGALAGQRANRGVFITTSTFSQQAVDFAGSVERIVLVDGSKLAELMIEYEVGLLLARCEYPRSILTISKSSGQLSNQALSLRCPSIGNMGW